MTDDEFDAALIEGAFEIAAREGWPRVSVLAAARAQDLPLGRARMRFSSKDAILLRLGRIADAHALMDAPEGGTVREKLFDLLMRRFDALQRFRAGILALLHALPGDPPTALLLASTTARSMEWMLEAAGVPRGGAGFPLATKGLLVVWLAAIRAWQRDDTADMGATMAALDSALARAEQAAGWFGRTAESGPKPFPEPDASFIAPEGPPPEAGVI